MNINLICVGNIKEKYLIQAINEYQTRISKFANIKVIELKEERLPKITL
jgi:23S rRNA (pseudouridine1915-N3)-methyltransferase